MAVAMSDSFVWRARWTAWRAVVGSEVELVPGRSVGQDVLEGGMTTVFASPMMVIEASMWIVMRGARESASSASSYSSRSVAPWRKSSMLGGRRTEGEYGGGGGRRSSRWVFAVASERLWD